MSRAFRILLVLALPLALASCKRSRPNVLIITIDTLRADHLGSYGYKPARTPVLDSLATEGVRCSDAISTAPITMPAHTTIFTGLFPPAHGVRDNGAYALGEDAVTLAERLHDAGYTTHAFVSALVLNRRYNLNQGFETYDDDLWAEDDPKLFMIRERQAPKTTDRFLHWFEGWNAKRDKPFFTWIHYFDPHQPYRASAQDNALSPTPYDAEIAGVDRQIGRIIDTLKRQGLLDNTLLIVTADHGESLGEHGEQTHAIFVYDATVHIPLILRYPKLLSPRIYDGPVRSVDITPTVLDLLGLEAGKSLDGRSLADSLRGKEAPPKLAQYSESLLSEVGFGMAPLFAVRNGGYKYVRAPRPELYDLQKDPGELNNLVTQFPREASRLNGELTRIIDESERNAVKAASSPISKETEESLQALGYLAPHGERAAMQGIDPKDGLPLHNKLEDARHLAQQRRWEESEALLLEVIEVTPRNVSAINVLGLMGIKEGDRDKALHYYQASLAIDPTQFRVYSILGALAMTDGDMDTAEKNFRRCLELNPHFAEAMANLGFIESLRGNEAQAEAWYRKGIAVDPTFPRVQRRLGDLYYERGDFARAYTYYLKSTQLLKSDVRGILQLGNCARRLNRPAEAEALFRRAEAIHPDGWIPTYNRACLLATTGRAPEALATLNALAARHAPPAQLVERDTDLTTVRALPGYAALKQQLAKSEGDGEEPEAE